MKSRVNTDKRSPCLYRLPMAFSVLLLGVSLPRCVIAQQWFELYGWNGHLGGAAVYDNEHSSGLQSSSQRRFFFREELALRTRGAIIHPNLASLSIGGQISGVQDDLRVTTEGVTTKQPGNELLYGYDANLSLVRTLPYNLDLFASRAEADVRRNFVGLTRVLTERFGSTIRGRDLPLESTVTIQEERLFQSLVGSQVQQDETRRSAVYRGRRRGDSADINVDYRFEDVEDRLREAGNFLLHAGGASHVWRLSPDRTRELFSTARIFVRDGLTIDNASVTVNENLRWKLRPNLWSDYNYSFSLVDSQTTRTTTQRGSAGLRHQWYQSLSTSVNVRASLSDFELGNEKSYGGGIGWSYNKLIPWRGRLTLDLAGSYLLTDRDVPPGLLSIFQERHVFTNGTPVILDNSDIVSSSIEVTDISGRIVYVEGVDYSVSEIGRSTEISRNPTGDITAGDTVLVSYDYEIFGAFRVASRPMSFGGGVDFGWVRLAYSGQRLREDLISGNPDATQGPVDDDLVEIAFSHRGKSTHLEAANEFRKYHSRQLSFQSFSFTQTASWQVSPKVRLQAIANQIFHDFQEPDRIRDFYRGRASVLWKPRYNVTGTAYGGVRWQKETDIPTETFGEAGASLRWDLGMLSADLSYDRDMHERGTSNRTGDLLRLEVRRSF